MLARLSFVGAALLAILCGCVFCLAACESDDGDDAENGGDDDAAEHGEAEIEGDEIYVPGGTIFFRGDEYNERAEVPPGSLVGVGLDGKGYILYHDGDDQTIELNDATTKDAVLLFALDYYAHVSGGDFAMAAVTPARNDDTIIDFGECGWWWDAYDYEFDSGVGMNDVGGGYYEFFNCKVRWAAVESLDDFVALAPQAHVPSIGMAIDYIMSNTFDDFAVDTTLEVSNIVRTYGAVVRVGFLPPPFSLLTYYDASFQESVNIAMETNPDLFMRLNAADLIYVLVKAVHDIVGLIPFEDCIDGVFVGAMVDMMNSALIESLLGDTAAQAMINEFFANFGDSAANCLIEAAVAPTVKGWLIYKAVEIVLTLGSLTEGMYVGGFDAATAAAYDDVVLEDFEYRFTLTWGETPRDLDSHLFTPVIGGDSHHVYFGNKGNREGAPYAELDVDDTSGFGPENLTVYELYPGTYVFAVHRYSSDDYMPGCGGRIVIQAGDGDIVGSVEVPGSEYPDYIWWHVAEIDGDTGEIRIIDELSNEPPTYY